MIPNLVGREGGGGHFSHSNDLEPTPNGNTQQVGLKGWETNKNMGDKEEEKRSGRVHMHIPPPPTLPTSLQYYISLLKNS